MEGTNPLLLWSPPMLVHFKYPQVCLTHQEGTRYGDQWPLGPYQSYKLRNRIYRLITWPLYTLIKKIPFWAQQKQTWKLKLEPHFPKGDSFWLDIFRFFGCESLSAKEPARHHANRRNSTSSGAERHAHKTGNPPPGYQKPHHSQQKNAFRCGNFSEHHFISFDQRSHAFLFAYAFTLWNSNIYHQPQLLKKGGRDFSD